MKITFDTEEQMSDSAFTALIELMRTTRAKHTTVPQAVPAKCVPGVPMSREQQNAAITLLVSNAHRVLVGYKEQSLPQIYLWAIGERWKTLHPNSRKALGRLFKIEVTAGRVRGVVVAGSDTQNRLTYKLEVPTSSSTQGV